MTDTLITLAAGLVFGFALGVGVGRSRRGALAENNHWVGETIEALKGADLDADVSRERALRLSGDTPAVDDLIPGFMADSGYRPPLATGGLVAWSNPPVVVSEGVDGCVLPKPDPADYSGIRVVEHLGQACEYLCGDEHICGCPATKWVTWDTGSREFLCDEHHDRVMGQPDPCGLCPSCDGPLVALDDRSRWCTSCTKFWDTPCGWSNGDTVCGDPSTGTVTWPGQGPVDLCDTHIQWAHEEVER